MERRAFEIRTLAAAALLMFLASPVHGADRCTAATQPSDHLATEICDTCPHDGPDATFRFLDRAADAARIPLKNRRLGAVAEKAVKDALSKGYDVGTKFDLSDYGVVGVDTSIAAILADQQSELQKQAAATGALWLKHTIAAQAAVNLGTTVPIGPNGFYVRTGAAAGAQMQVTVERRYDARLADLARNATVNQLTIPYAAVDAAALKAGERVTISGNGSVAVSGGAGYGVNVESVIPSVSVGATATAGAAHVLHGDFTTVVTKESANNVRVTLQTNRGHDTSADARIFVGAAINRDGQEIPVETGINVLDATTTRGGGRLAREAEKILSAEFTTRHGDLTNEGNLQEYTFDLSRREARRAYEDALLGDYRAASELSACDGTGVGFVKETNDVVETAYHSTKLAVSLLKYTVNSSSTDDARTIRDAAGLRKFDLFAFHYDSRAFSGSYARVDVGTVAAVSGVVGADGRSVHLTYRGEMENRFFTSRGEMKDILHIGRSMAGADPTAEREMARILDSKPAGLRLPDFINRYGRTKMALDLTISKSGIDRIANTTPEEMWAAFAATRRETPEWATPEGRADMQEYDRERGFNNERGSGRNHNSEQYFWSSYVHTRDAIASLSQLKDAATDSDRARLLRDAAEAMGNDFTAGAALANLSGDRSRKVSFGVKNENVDYTWTQLGEDAAPLAIQ